MSSCEWELQKAAYTALTADGSLMAMISGIYDHVPQHSSFPYVVLQEIYAVDSSNVSDTVTEIRMVLGVYIRERGSKTAFAIMAQVKEVLHHAALTVPGYTLVSLYMMNSELQQMTDGVSYAGKMIFKGYVIG